MTNDEKQAVAATVAIRFSKSTPSGVREAMSYAYQHGHALVSQGCTLFRCVNCDTVGFATSTYDSAFSSKCEPWEVP